MNHLDKLISQYCPNGVQWVKLNKLGRFYGGLTGKNKADFVNGNAKFISYKNIYNNPALDMDIQEYVCIKPEESQNIVQFGDILFTGSSETPDECGLSSVVNIQPKDNLYLNSFCFGFRMSEPKLLNIDFAKHLFRSNELRQQIAKTADGVTRFNVSKERFGNISIPLPPLPVQQEIVRILDSMTALIANLDSEIAARRQQYAHYHKQLLAFHQEVEWKSLGEVFEMRNGYTPSKSNPSFWEGGTIPWFRMEDIRENGRILGDAIQHITAEAVKGKGLFEADSFILATTATIGEHALLIADSLANQQFTNLKIRKSLKNKLLTKFVFYYFDIIDDFCKNHTNKSGFESVDMEALRRMPIPLPPLPIQQKIVAKLDTLESLLATLRHERTLRQQQYEYYRERLLSFKETK